MVAAAAASVCLVLGAAAAAQPAPPKPQLADLLLTPISVSEITNEGRTYSVFISRPPTPPPPGGFPLLVVLDANSNFAAAANSAWARSAFSDMAPIVVVGIGYPTGNPLVVGSRRTYDFTSSNPTDEPSPDLKGKALGGGEAFRTGVVAQVLRKMDREEHVDPACHTIFGHSLGGFFVADTLVRHPDMFEGYFAASPSLWFNNFDIFDRVPPKAVFDRLTHPVRVRLEVGALEAKISERQLKAFPAFRTARDAKMVSSPQRLFAELTALGSSKLQVSTAILPDQSHLSEVPGVIGEAITFASQCPSGSEGPK